MSKQDKEVRQLRQIRTELALALTVPSGATYYNYLHYKQTRNESCNTLAVKVLSELIKIEPSIEKVLSLCFGV